MPTQSQSHQIRRAGLFVALSIVATSTAHAQAPQQRAWQQRPLGGGDVLQFIEAGQDRWAVTSQGLYKRGYGIWDRQPGLPAPFHTQIAAANNGTDLYAVQGTRTIDYYDEFWAASPKEGAVETLLRSRDGGDSWLPLRLPAEAAGAEAVTVAPSDPRRVWVLDRDLGLLRSTNRGVTWRVETSLPQGAGPLDVGLPRVDPSNPQRIFLKATERYFRSEDGGMTWQLASDSTFQEPTFDPNRPGVMWALKRRRLSQSLDYGQTWRETEPPIGWDRNISVPSHSPQLVGATMHEGVRVSRDGGSTFFNFYLPQGVLANAVTFDRRGRILVATDGAGVYRAEIGRGLQALNLGLDAASVRAIRPLPTLFPQVEGNAEDLYSGVARAGLYFSHGPEPSIAEGGYYGRPWHQIFRLVADPFNSLHALEDHFGYINVSRNLGFSEAPVTELVATEVDGAPRLYNSSAYTYGFGSGVQRSDDSGETWTHFPSTEGYPDADTRKLAVDATDGARVLIFEAEVEHLGSVIRNFLKRTTDGGVTWTTVATVPFNVHALVADPTVGDRFWFGIDSEEGSGLFLSTDGGSSLTPRGFEGQLIRRIEVDPGDPDHVWVSVPHEPGVWETRDAGFTWNLTPGSEHIIPTDLALGTVGTLYAASARGTWQLDFAALPGAPTTLQDRFDIKVAWRDEHNRLHPGREVQTSALASDSAAFWFFDEDNVELLVKVLDGRTINNHFWIFSGVATDVAYCLEVVDRVTGKTFSHCQEKGQQRSIADVEALPALAPQALSTAPGLSTSDATANPRLSRAARQSIDLSLPSSATTERAQFVRQTGTVLPLTTGPTGLDLSNGELRVEMSFVTPDGETNTATAVPITDDAGAFWFFGPNNLEILLKVLDARVINGKYWVFWGSLTTLEYTIEIFSDCCGDIPVWTHTQPAGPATSGSDTDAF